MTFNTGNPVPSSDAKDLSDNAENLDSAVNTTVDTWIDRLGSTRSTLAGQLKKLGFEPPELYAGSIAFTVSDNTKTIDRNGIVYAPLPSEIPFTTTGTWSGDDEGKFFVVQGLTSDSTEIVLSANTVAELKTKDLQPGQTISTKGYHTEGDGGGAVYVIQASQAVDGYGDHALDNGNVAILQHGGVVNVKQYGAVGDYYLQDGNVNPAPTDDIEPIKAILAATSNEDLLFPKTSGYAIVGYAISEPIQISSYYTNLIGEGDEVEIVKTTNTAGVGSATNAKYGLVSYAVDAVIIKELVFDSTILGSSVKNLTIYSVQNSDYGIFAPIQSKIDDSDLTIVNCKTGYSSIDTFLSTLTRTWVRNDKTGSIPSTLAYEFQNGTSLTFLSCWAKNVVAGFDLGSVAYSSLHSCGCDKFTSYAYNGGASIGYYNCGFEEAELEDGGFVFGAGAREITISGGAGVSVSATGTSNIRLFNFNGTRANISNLRLPNFLTTGVYDLFDLQGDAKVTIENNLFPPPSEYNNFVTFDSSFGSLVERLGESERIYSLDSEIVQKGLNQYNQDSTFKFGERGAVGLPSEASIQLNPSSALYKNTVAVTNSAVNVLTYVDPGNNYVLSIYCKGVLNSFTDSAVVETEAMVVNSTQSVGASQVVIGNGAYTLTASWSGTTLQLTAGGGANSGAVEVTVCSRPSTGTPTFAWD